jgi:hypothetical protein
MRPTSAQNHGRFTIRRRTLGSTALQSSTSHANASVGYAPTAMASFLSGLPLFAGLAAADCAQLDDRMPRRAFAPGARARLTLAMTNPNNVVAFDDVRRVVNGVLIEPVVVTDEHFKRFMNVVSIDA